LSSLEDIARQAECEGELERAFEAWRQLASESKDPAHYCHLGFAANNLGKWKQAEEAFLSALQLEPRLAEAMTGLGVVYLERTDGDRVRNFEEAKAYLLRASEIERTAHGMSLLGITHRVLHEDDAARSAFTEALRIDPNYEEAYFNLSQFEMENDPIKAINLLGRALEIDPDYSRAHEKMGELLQRRKDLIGAERHFRRCIEIDALDYWAHLHLANNLYAQGRHSEAEREYRLAINVHPEEKAGIQLFASFLSNLSRHEEAAELRSRVAAADDEH